MTEKHKYLIAGNWRESKESLEVRNPYNDEIAGTIFLATEEDVKDAVQSATRAFAETRRLPGFKKSQILNNIANNICKEKELLARTITLESGKPIRDARVEVERSVGIFQLAAEESKRSYGEYIPLDVTIRSKNRSAIHKRFPIGAILGITPFNFPLNLVTHKVAPALASGNPVIIKPSIKTPLTALLLGKIISESDWPAGGLSIIPCSDKQAECMVKDDRIQMLTFTGSAEVGWKLREIAGKKRVTLELGGNAGTIIESTDDLDYAVKRCALSAFSFSGQICISLQRLFINKTLYNDFLTKFLQYVKTFTTGNPLSEETRLGPMIDKHAVQRAASWVNEAVKVGAKIIHGGNFNGTLYEPTILTHTTPHMKVNKNEVFAPIVTVTEYTSFEQAVSLINDSDYGLQAGVFTNNIKQAFFAYEHLEVGGVMINDAPSFRADNMPYGGIKDSGTGREGVRYAIEEMTESKLLVFNLS